MHEMTSTAGFAHRRQLLRHATFPTHHPHHNQSDKPSFPTPFSISTALRNGLFLTILTIAILLFLQEYPFITPPAAVTPFVRQHAHAKQHRPRTPIQPITLPTSQTSHDSPIVEHTNGHPTSSPHINLTDTLSAHLNFSNRTTLNFMHFHKTGGVSVKSSLLSTFQRTIKPSTGQPILVRDSCYRRLNPPGSLTNPSVPTFEQWRCDWQPVRDKSLHDRHLHDVVLGHQFTGPNSNTNIQSLLSPARIVRSFTVLRPPLDRKLSFYFHFFARERRRLEADVSLAELRAFAVREAVPQGMDVGRDAGPNYFAGRLLSDGRTGFATKSNGGTYHSWFVVEQNEKEHVVQRAKKVLDDYLFIGLQSEPSATWCMLRRVVHEFDKVMGIDLAENTGLSKKGNFNTKNAGSYDANSTTLWNSMTDVERKEFESHEYVDRRIYEHGEQLFCKHVKLFGCMQFIANPLCPD